MALGLPLHQQVHFRPWLFLQCNPRVHGPSLVQKFTAKLRTPLLAHGPSAETCLRAESDPGAEIQDKMDSPAEPLRSGSQQMDANQP